MKMDPKALNPEELHVGQRVKSIADGCYATIRYIGKLSRGQDLENEEVRVGVEWDLFYRGKHDGVAGDIRYFSKMYSKGELVLAAAKLRGMEPRNSFETAETSASFVKTHVLTSGRTFEEAILWRYSAKSLSKKEANASDELKLEEHFIESEAGSVTNLQMIGMNKAFKFFRQLSKLKFVSLPSESIAKPGNVLSLGLDALEELDLEHNLLSSWDDIFSIIKYFPKLRFLNISKNRLQNLSLANHDATFPGIEVLHLNNTFISPKEVLLVGQLFPNLKSLSLCINYFTSEDMYLLLKLIEEEKREPCSSYKSGSSFPKLIDLFLIDNLIDDLALLPRFFFVLESLRFLALNENYLGDIASIADADTQLDDLREQSSDSLLPKNDFLERANALWIDYNAISSWKTFYYLSKLFKKLAKLKWQHNPLLLNKSVGGVDFCRHVVTSIFPELEVLNGTQVKSSDRRVSERYFIFLTAAKNKVILEVDPPEAGHAHNKRLLEIHQDLAAAPLLNAGESESSSVPLFSRSLVAVWLVPETEKTLGRAPSMRKLPLNMTLTELKVLCTRLFGIPAVEQQLMYNNGVMPISVKLEDDSRDLAYYGLEDNHTIRIKSISETD